MADALRKLFDSSAGQGYRLTRLVFQRGLALVYFLAFLVAVNQFVPLLGENGILPAPLFVKRVPFTAAPSLFFLFPSDGGFTAAAWLGVALSLLALTGLSERRGGVVSVLVWSGIWVLYLSFVNVGQDFYGFGWETMLLEAGFLAIFLGDANTAPSLIPILLIRWDALSDDVRRRADQAARRSVLEGPDLSLLPLRNAADAQSVFVVVSLAG